MKTKVVIDTNVIVSAIVFPRSITRKAYDFIQKQSVNFISEETFAEVTQVLMRSKFDKYISIEDRENFLSQLESISTIVKVTESTNVCRDEKDNKFLELAVSAKIDYLITGDQDLLTLNPFEKISILTPTQFLETFESSLS